ncbi:hypothetical protein NUSPORA_01833 [Nucleospora cyclopteri]
MSLKLIKPAYEASNLVYIFNYWKTLGKIAVGCEIVGLENFIGLGFSGRFANEKTVTCFNLQRFNLITFSFYRKITPVLDAGIEIKKNLEQKAISLSSGARIKNKNSEIKCTLDDKFNLGFSWEENISNCLTIGLSGEYNYDAFSYGISMIYED